MAEDTFRVVSVLDPGIDTERMTMKELRAYSDSRDIAKIEPFYKPGSLVTEYLCREVPHALWERFVMADDSQAAQFRRAFQAGIVSAKNLPQRDGTFVPSWSPPRINDVATDESMERFSASDRTEIGLVIWQRSFLAPRTAPTYPLPDSVVVCLGARGFRRAEPSPSTPATSSDEASSRSAATQAAQPETDKRGDNCAETSASPTDASATERSAPAA